MCIIIDICTLADVFEKDSVNHVEFAPVLRWISCGKGKLLYGGTKYKKELIRTKYVRTFLELRKSGKAVALDDNEVDQQHAIVRGKKESKRYNDPHLVAIVIVSQCRVVCTKDTGAMKFLREKAFYPKNIRRPKIYCRKSHKNLLVGKCTCT
jgi:hypothetical protein